MVRITFAVIVLCAGACAATNQQKLQARAAEKEPEPGPGVTCQWEQPTGSLIRKRVCRFDDELERSTKTAHDLWTRPRPRPGFTE